MGGTQIPRADITIPLGWLDPSFDVEVLRTHQRPGTEVTVGKAALTITGTELVLERRWFTEEHWTKIYEAIRHGYIQGASETEVSVSGDRRSSTPRRTPVLLARLRERSRL